MKHLLFLFTILAFAVSLSQAAEKKRYVLYATLLETTPVELSDGAKWMMDRGDTFPLLMFKQNQTKVVLQLAGASFWVDAARVKVLEEREVTPEQLATYRHNVESYIGNRSRQWTEQAAKKK